MDNKIDRDFDFQTDNADTKFRIVRQTAAVTLKQWEETLPLFKNQPLADDDEYHQHLTFAEIAILP